MEGRIESRPYLGADSLVERYDFKVESALH